MALGTNRGSANPFDLLKKTTDIALASAKKAKTQKTVQPVTTKQQESKAKVLLNQMTNSVIKSAEKPVITETKKPLTTAENKKNISVFKDEEYLVEVLKDFKTDIGKTDNIDKLIKAYPEIPAEIIPDLYTDLKKGGRYTDIKKVYPELSTIKRPEEKKATNGSRYSIVADETETNIFGIPKVPKITEFSQGDEETVGGVLLGFGGNVLKSTVNLGSDIINFVADPVDSVKGLGKMIGGAVVNTYETVSGKEVGGELGKRGESASQALQYFKDRYGSFDKFSKSAFTDPMGVFSDALSLISGGSTIASKLAIKGGQVTKLSTLTKAGNFMDDIAKVMNKYDPAEVIMRGTYKKAKTIGEFGVNQTKTVGAIVKKSLQESKVIKGISEMKNPIKTATKNISEGFDEMVSGFTKNQKRGIQANPYQKEYVEEAMRIVDQEGLPQQLKELRTKPLTDLESNLESHIDQKIDSLSYAGSSYNEIKKINIEIDKSSSQPKIDTILNNEGIKVKPNGEWDFADSPFTTTEVNAIKDLYMRMFTNPTTDVAGILNIRKLVSKSAKYELGVNTDAQRLMKAMRKEIDDVAKTQVPKLKELDESFSKQIQDLEEAKEGIFYKDKKRINDFRDNIQSILSTVNNPAKAKLKERLLEIMPDIALRVEAINNLPNIIKTLNQAPNLTSSLIGGGIGGAVGSALLTSLGMNGFAGTIGGAILGYFGEKYLRGLRAKSLQTILSNLSPEGIENLAEIGKKIAENEELSKTQIDFMEKLKREISQVQEESNRNPALPYKPMYLGEKGIILAGKPITPDSSLGQLQVVQELPYSRTLKRYNIEQPKTSQDLRDMAEKKRTDKAIQDKITELADKRDLYDELGDERATNAFENAQLSNDEIRNLVKNGEMSIDEVDDLIRAKEQNMNSQLELHTEIKKAYGLGEAYRRAPIDMIARERDKIQSLRNLISDSEKTTNDNIMKQTEKSPLYEEARKYKSADDMIEGLEKDGKILYHGTNEVFEKYDSEKAMNKGERGENLWGFGFYTTPNKRMAENYGSNVMKMKIDYKNPLNLSDFNSQKDLADYLDISEDIMTTRNGEPSVLGKYANQLSSNAEYLGHDAIIANGGKEIVILKGADIKTEFELRKIREEANPPGITTDDILFDTASDIYRHIEEGKFDTVDSIFEKIDKSFEKGKLDQKSYDSLAILKEEHYNNPEYQKAFNEKILKETFKNDAYWKSYESIKKQVQVIESKEQRIGKVGNKKVGSTYKETQSRQREKDKEKLLKMIMEELSVDQFDAVDIYNQMV